MFNYKEKYQEYLDAVIATLIVAAVVILMYGFLKGI